MKYNNIIIKKVIRRSDILVVALSDSRIKVKALPNNRFEVNCPYHDDSKPSMVIDRKDNHFYCYGCKAKGNVLNFFVKVYDLKFLQAVETIAYAFDIKMPDRSYVEIDYDIAERLKEIKNSEEYSQLLKKSYVKTLKK